MRRFLPTLLLMLVPLYALSQAPSIAIEHRLTAAQLHATGLDTLTPDQLALLNRLLSEEVRATSRGSAPASAMQGTSALATPAPMAIGLEEGPVHSRLVGTLDGWAPGTVFVLANGQKWKVLKGQYRLRASVQDPEIDIVPGLAGRWFFKLDEDTPGPRVYRIE